jgi:tetratricopeptide (TPR) repeat protein
MRRIISIIAIGGIVLMSGCNGPTKAGQEARGAARDRMNFMNAQITYDQARQSFDVGQFDKALREINNAISRFPTAAEYFILQGRIYLETHKLELAADSFQHAIDTIAAAKKQAGADERVAQQKDSTKDSSGADAAVQGVNRVLAEAHYYLGIVYQRWSDNEKAYGQYLQAFQLETSKVDYLLASAESLVALNRFDEAKTLVSDKATYFEHNAALRQLLGQIALLQGDAPLAVRLYGEARLLNPDDNALLEDLMWAQYAAASYGQCLESIKLLQSRLAEKSAQSKSGPKNPANLRDDLMHLQARCFASLGRNTEARDLYMELTRLRPADPEVWIELGTLAWDLGDYRRVALSSVQILSLTPDRYEGWMLKGINEQQKNNTETAIKLFREASRRATDAALPHMLLGKALEESGDVTGALQAYRDAVTVEPDNADARNLLQHAQGLRLTSTSGTTGPVQ